MVFLLKSVPEDFLVEEVLEEGFVNKIFFLKEPSSAINHSLAEDLDKRAGSGSFLLLKVFKKKLNTVDALDKLSSLLGLSLRKIGYGGNKDRLAVTAQYVTIPLRKGSVINDYERVVNSLRESGLLGGFGDEGLSSFLKNHEGVVGDSFLKVFVLGFVSEGLSLGSLSGNRFSINIRGLSREEEDRLLRVLEEGTELVVPNFFGEQRFSKENERIGLLIIKGSFSEAAIMIIKQNKGFQRLVEKKGYLEDGVLKDPIMALRLLNKHHLMLYLHSFQSLLFNKLLSAIIKKGLENEGVLFVEEPHGVLFPKRVIDDRSLLLIERLAGGGSLPIVGFSFEEEDHTSLVKELVNNFLLGEGLSTRSFIIRSLPMMSLEGGSRDSFIKTALSYDLASEGVLNLSFFLPKGSYATVLVDYLRVLSSD